MVEAEFVICHLRSQVRNLQSMLNYLESREGVGDEEYAYLQTKLHEVIGRLRDVQRFSGRRSDLQQLQAQWLN